MGKYTNIFVTIRYRCRDHIIAVQSCIHRKTIFPMGCPLLLLSMSVQREARERFSDRWDCRFFAYLGNIVMLVNLGEEDGITKLTDDCDHFCKWTERFYNAVVTIGIGKVCTELQAIRFSYESAREAVSYRMIYGEGRSINIADIAPKGQELSMQPEDINLNDVFKAIHIGVREDIEHAVLFHGKGA